MKKKLSLLSRILGIENKPVSHTERLISAAGGFIAILTTLAICQFFLGLHNAAVLVASMGASAVLLFAVPHGPLSQPWSVFGGHVSSAVIGVSCALWINNDLYAAATAVGLATGAMYYLRCIHPPGGATALSAVLGGDALHALGYQYVLTPVMLNVVTLLALAFLYNYLFSWRRYPVYLQRTQEAPQKVTETNQPAGLSQDDVEYAFSQIDSYIDVNEYDLYRIYELANTHAKSQRMKSEDILLGCYYSNGQFGETWSVRQVVDESKGENSTEDIVIYKVIAGHQQRSSGYMPRDEFARWAKYQVILDQKNWQRVLPAE
ncbi:MAG: HPP family protein [Gammaproteobacteria bacterium]|nr:HPP family protein [Gammaproteobacteria bacterium]